MVLAVNSVGPNPQTPGIAAELFVPDQLIAGNLKLVSAPITLGAGTLQRGTVLGQQTKPSLNATAVAAVIPTNTGNGTFGTITVGAAASLGTYVLTMESATTFLLSNPAGMEIGHGSTGVAFNVGGIGFTLTAGGTAFVAGDGFTITTSQSAAASGNYITSVATATDGSQVPAAILADFADASGGAVATGAYLMGEFNSNAITFDASWTVATLTPLLRPLGIFLKSFVSATPET